MRCSSSSGWFFAYRRHHHRFIWLIHTHRHTFDANRSTAFGVAHVSTAPQRHHHSRRCYEYCVIFYTFCCSADFALLTHTVYLAPRDECFYFEREIETNNENTNKNQKFFFFLSLFAYMNVVWDTNDTSSHPSHGCVYVCVCSLQSLVPWMRRQKSEKKKIERKNSTRQMERNHSKKPLPKWCLLLGIRCTARQSAHYLTFGVAFASSTCQHMLLVVCVCLGEIASCVCASTKRKHSE